MERYDEREQQRQHRDACKALEVVHNDEKKRLMLEHSEQVAKCLGEVKAQYGSQITELQARHKALQKERSDQHARDVAAIRNEAMEQHEESASRQLAYEVRRLEHQMQRNVKDYYRRPVS